MKILELIGQVLRPVHSDESKLTEAEQAVAEQPHGIGVASPEFSHNGPIPAEYSIDGKFKFPAINWANVPNTCKSLALVIEDPDAPKPAPFVHGIIYNIPPNLNGLPEDAFRPYGLSPEYVNLGLKMGRNTLGKTAYLPPAPPEGNGLHHYHFQLIALDAELTLPDSPALSDLKSALVDHVVGSGELIGTYQK